MSDLVQKMRGEFEAWLKSEYPQEVWSTARYLEDDGSDQYREDFVEGAWRAWQVRQALGSAQEREEAVAPVMWQYRIYHTDPDDSGWGLWHDCHDASTATRLQSSEGYQVRHLYAAPTDAQRVAELEAQLAARNAIIERMAIDHGQTQQQLTESREREGRLADVIAHCETAFGSIHEYWNRDTNEDAMSDALSYAIDTSRLALEKIAALAAEKGGE